jgi:mRNA interferase MazF
MLEIRHGDLFWFDFGDPKDVRQAGSRPALVIQSNIFNENGAYPLTLIVPVTTKGKRFHVEIQPDSNNGLLQVSYIKCEQIYTVLKSELGTKIGFLNATDIIKVKVRSREVMSI